MRKKSVGYVPFHNFTKWITEPLQYVELLNEVISEKKKEFCHVLVDSNPLRSTVDIVRSPNKKESI